MRVTKNVLKNLKFVKDPFEHKHNCFIPSWHTRHERRGKFIKNDKGYTCNRGGKFISNKKVAEWKQKETDYCYTMAAVCEHMWTDEHFPLIEEPHNAWCRRCRIHKSTWENRNDIVMDAFYKFINSERAKINRKIDKLKEDLTLYDEVK